MTTYDCGLSVLAKRLHSIHSWDTATEQSEAAAILGERGVYLPDGLTDGALNEYDLNVVAPLEAEIARLRAALKRAVKLLAEAMCDGPTSPKLWADRTEREREVSGFRDRACIALLNGDLLEDFDGAPFPDEVQAAFAVRLANAVPAKAEKWKTLMDLPVVEPVGHGNPDHCAVHGDIPRDVSIVAHINAEHDISYETHRALEEARDAIIARGPAVPVDAERLRRAYRTVWKRWTERDPEFWPAVAAEYARLSKEPTR